MKKLINILILISFVFISNAQLYIGNSTYIVMTNGQITISNMNFKNDGTFTSGTGTVNFTGTVDQNIQGASLTTFNNIKINNASDLIADVDFDVKGNLEFTNGELDLKNSIVSLGTTGVIVNETETNRIKVGDPTNNTGTITIDRTINNATYNYTTLANIGIELITNKNLGNITISRGHQIQNGMGNQSIKRYYIIPGIGEITITNNIKMKYFDVELNGLIETNLIYFQEVSDMSTWWTPCLTTITLNEAEFNDSTYDDWIYDHLVSFDDKFTLASKNDPLPIELLTFTANCINNQIILEWTTASEINNDYFILEHSIDGLSFKPIDNINGAGNSSVFTKYSFIHDNPNASNNYYKLTQVDFDGNFETFDVITTNCNTEQDFIIYPNPSNRSSFITICCDTIENLRVTNVLGQDIPFIKNGNEIQINIPGTYLIIINNTQIEKIIIH